VPKKQPNYCRFCKQSKMLCKSHITPKWLFKDRGTGSFFQIGEGDPFKRSIPEGWKEYLLCKDCEDHMGVYDNYASEFFRSAASWQLATPHDFRLWVVRSFDYKTLKLFFMSILWRASVATIPAYQYVELADDELTRLHEMLWTHDPGDVQDFTALINKREPMENGLEKITVAPFPLMKSGILHYKFDLNEFSCQIKASSQAEHSNEDFFLSPGSPLLIYEGKTVAGRINQLTDIVKAQPALLAEYRALHRAKRDSIKPD
jgi:hypothetical protein